MTYTLSLWQHIPEHLNPIAFSVGFFSIRWYALFFVVGFFVVLAFCMRSFRPDSSGFNTKEDLVDTLLAMFIGALIGGRLGYVFLYDPAFFFESPFRIILPYNAESGWTGLSGMSFHGGLIGAVLVFVFMATRRRFPLWRSADFLALAVPIALFFGRLGNFFNLELYGRVTSESWGMIFPGTWPIGALRHPSQLYEAFFEGIVLFCVLYFYRKRAEVPGGIAALFLITYAFFRFLAEYFREPDPQVGLLAGNLSLGQWLSLAMMCAGALLLVWLRKKNNAILVIKNDGY
jgi:phosphatidylglycerol:prolipoprotein diacylglycerol transferase